jgi:hypothetical protein
MVGGFVVQPYGAYYNSVITGYTSSTSVTVAVSGSFTNTQVYIYYNSLSCDKSGNTGVKNLVISGTVTDSVTSVGTSAQVLSSTGTATKWITPVSSVGLSMPSYYTVTNSPVTSSGTLTATLNSQSGNLFLASPNGSSGTPSFRAITTADLPSTLKSIFTFNSVSNVVTGQYVGQYGISGTIAKCEIIMTRAGTLANMYGYISAIPGGTAAQNFTLYKNGSAQTLALGFSASVQNTSDVTHTVSVVAGDLITILNTQSNSPTGASAVISFEFS